MERPYVQNRLPLSLSPQSLDSFPLPFVFLLPILIIQRNDGFPRATEALLSLLPAAAGRGGATRRRGNPPVFPLMRDHARNYMVIPGGNVHQLSWALA